MWNKDNTASNSQRTNQNYAKEGDFSFTVHEKIAAFGEENENGYMLALTKTSFCGREAQYDLRPWNKDFTKMGKGIRLTEEQLADMIVYFREGGFHENKN